MLTCIEASNVLFRPRRVYFFAGLIFFLFQRVPRSSIPSALFAGLFSIFANLYVRGRVRTANVVER